MQWLYGKHGEIFRKKKHVDYFGWIILMTIWGIALTITVWISPDFPKRGKQIALTL